jgi:hypothetical protein
MEITITGTGRKRDHYYNEICRADKDFPRMINRGWNTFEFVNDVKFIFKNMPDNVKMKGDKYTWFLSNLTINTPSDYKLFTYAKTVDNITGEIISETIY